MNYKSNKYYKWKKYNSGNPWKNRKNNFSRQKPTPYSSKKYKLMNFVNSINYKLISEEKRVEA